MLAGPRYLQEAMGTAQLPPGHRFRLFFDGWASKYWDQDPKKRLPPEGKTAFLERAQEVRQEVRRQIDALVERQTALSAAATDTLTIRGTSTAPLVTGMGMEHPLENGFAFLDPYGVPYLPGSSVKGVVRRAAEELALLESEPAGWSIFAVWWLFGFDATSGYFAVHERERRSGRHTEADVVLAERESLHSAYHAALAVAQQHPEQLSLLAKTRRALLPPDSDLSQVSDVAWAQGLSVSPESSAPCSELRHLSMRGACEFWDAIPQPPEGPGSGLRVDIMNPHYAHYYADGEPPHDAGSPNPILFLTVPPGWHFSFFVHLRPQRQLPSWFLEQVDGRTRWRSLMENAFEYAFEWLGFGAKTSVGYGAMYRDLQAERERDAAEERRRREIQEERLRAAEEARLAALSPVDRLLDRLNEPSHDEVIDAYQQLDELSGHDQVRLARALKAAMGELGEWKVKKKKRKQWERVQRIKALIEGDEG